MTQAPVQPQPSSPAGRRRAPPFDAAKATLDELFAALEHPSRRVSRAARNALARRADVPRDRLWALLATTRKPVTAGHVIKLFARGERADSITWLLNACALGPDTVRAEARLYLDRWGEFDGPVPADRVAPLRAALHRAWPWVPRELTERLSRYAGITPPRRPFKSAPPPVAPPARPARLPALVPSVAREVGTYWNGLFALAEAVAQQRPKPQLPPPPLDYQVGRVVLRRYVLPPVWPAPWRYVFRRR
jgi:hypothetical protein